MLILFSLLLLMGFAEEFPPPEPPQVVFVPFRADDPAIGPKLAKVTIVEFSDFQCPHCADVNPKLKKLFELYPSNIKLIFKHQPLPRHEHAMQAAEAAEAAREQGKFWEMHDLLYARQNELGPSRYEEWAKEIGLDLARFRQSMSEHRNESRIREDARLQDSTGTRGTPTFFINGRSLLGNLPFDQFQSVVEQQIQLADGLLKNGNTLDDSFYQKIVQENIKSTGATIQTQP
jgi:protein-disulfide isomerase